MAQLSEDSFAFGGTLISVDDAVAILSCAGAGRKVSSRVETDGLVELGEETTLVQPGQTVGFLSYASLI